MENINYLDWQLFLGSDGDRPYLQIRFMAEDSITKNTETQFGRKWMLSFHMTPTEVVSTAWKAILSAVEHEARENFRYKGKAIFGPHIDVEALYSVCKDKKFDYRKTPERPV